MSATRGVSDPVPIPLRRVIDAGALCRENPCDRTIVLGSFWPNSRHSFESHVVKSFKECLPARDYQPHISALCDFYARLILSALGDAPFDSVVRVLGSSEREPETDRPQTLLVEKLCALTGATNLCAAFFKSESRPSMRTVDRLSGPDALRPRIQYVVQDLFVRPREDAGTVLLVDDIYNTGASAQVYSRALKDHAGASKVISANLAATRFHRGRDGHGALTLDASALQSEGGLRCVWLDRGGVCHDRAECPGAAEPLSPEMEFIAMRSGARCPVCRKAEAAPRRRWWQVF